MEDVRHSSVLYVCKYFVFVPEPAVAVAADLALGVEGLAVAADGVAALLAHVVELRPDCVAVAPEK